MRIHRNIPVVSCFRILLASLCLAGPLHAEVITVMAANLTTTGQKYGDQAVRIFQALKPDIILIQEFNVQTERRAFVDAACGPGYFFYCEPETGGIPNGIISRWAFQTCGEWDDQTMPNRDFAWAVIDIPGELDLQAVSVHLKSGDKPRDFAKRLDEAGQLKVCVEKNFKQAEYIVIGGDFNTPHRVDPAVKAFKTFLAVDTHIPRDLRGNSTTNKPRSKPYDWLMPNRLLDSRHATLRVGSTGQFYPEGIVFDSEVFVPLSAVAPVRKGDSRDNGMQHMAVMKAFDIPVTNRPAVVPRISPLSSPPPEKR